MASTASPTTATRSARASTSRSSASTRRSSPSVPSPTFPNVTMTSLYSLGTNNNFYYVHHSKNFSAGIAKYLGRHNLKGGFDYRRIHDDGNDFGNSAGAFTFNGVFTRSTPLTAVAGTGADLADMLLGAPASGTGFIPTKLYEYADYYGALLPGRHPHHRSSP